MVDSQEEISTRRLGRYVIHGTIAATGTAEVLAGYDPRLDRVVAIKRVIGGAATAEARLHARLDHPGIVRVYESFTHDGDDYIVSELVNGVSLATLVFGEAKGSGLDIGRALDILHAITVALAHAHAKGVVHRDVKVENVLVASDGAVKLTDFGLAEDAEASSRDAGLSGTLRCMSPEQSWGRPADERSDIFSLGVCFYEVLTGRSPFGGRDAFEILRNVRETFVPRARDVREDVPSELSELVERMLEKRPEHRPTADAVVHVLARLRERRLPVVPSAKDTVSRQVAVAVLRAPEPRAGTRERLQHVLGLRAHVLEATERAGGSILYTAGDRIAVCIGYPTLHDDNCERAAELLMDVHSAPEHDGVASALDFGMATILPGRGTPDAVGEVVDSALGLSFLARAGEVLLMPGPAGVLARSFEVQPDSRSWVTSGERVAAVSRLDVLASPRRARGVVGRVPLVGRDEPLHRLDAAHAAARGGSGTAWLVVGEAGVGKTRLLQEWRTRLRAESEPWALSGSGDSRYTPFEAIRRLVASRLGIADGDAAPTRAALEAAATRLGITEPRWIDTLAILLDPGAPQDASLSRDQVLDRLAGVLLAMASHATSVLLVEDLHWLDHSSLAVVQRLVGRVAHHSLLLVLTARPDIDLRWPEAKDLKRIELSRLDDAHATKVVEAVTGRRASPRAVRTIVRQAEGVPLLLEQLSYAVVAAAGDVAQEDALLRSTPTPLRDSLQRRLEGLGRARRTLESLAVLGHDVPEEVVRAVAVVDEQTAASHFEEARRADLLDGGSRPAFRHALIREAVYESMSEAYRTELHTRVVTTLGDRFESLVTSRPELYARHYEVAGQVERAIALWEKAGIAARRRWAYEDASRHLRSSLELLTARLPSSPDRDRRERDLLRSLYPAETAVNGWADESVKQLLSRGKEIDARLGDTPALGALWGQWIMSLISHDLAGLETALGAIASAGHTTEGRFMSDIAIGVTSYHRGDLSRASDHLVAARETVLGSLEGRLAPAEILDLSAVSGWSEEVLASPSLYLGVIETCRGRWSAADRLQEEAEAIADRIGSLYALSFALGVRTVTALIRHDTACSRAGLSRLEELCAGDAGWLAYARAQLMMAKARIQVDAGDAAAGASEFTKAVGILAAMGFKVSSELHAAACADACREAGLLEEAERQLAVGLALADHELARIYAPEVYLAAARLAQARGRADDASKYVQRARAAFQAIRVGEEPARLIAHFVDAAADPSVGAFTPS